MIYLIPFFYFFIHINYITSIEPGSTLTDEQKNHPSETSLDSVEPDYVFYNEGTIEYLKVCVKEFVEYELNYA